MKKETTSTILRSIKWLLALLATLVWIYIIYAISQAPMPFTQQGGYCMVSTMMVFGLLSLAFKFIDHIETTL
jgi:uncharacterized membrane protein